MVILYICSSHNLTELAAVRVVWCLLCVACATHSYYTLGELHAELGARRLAMAMYARAIRMCLSLSELSLSAPTCSCSSLYE